MAVRVEGVHVPPDVHGASISAHFGEIHGLYGLIGSGRTSLLQAIFGARAHSQGAIALETDGSPATARSPADAIAAGVGMVPEHRVHDALLPDRSIAENMALATVRRFSRRFGVVDRRRERAAVGAAIERLAIDCRNPGQAIRELSGGNQQKAVIARWLLRDCRVLLFDEPTQGIDVHTRAAIYALLRRLADEGRSIIVASSEPDELMQIADTITVLAEGRVSACLPRSEASEQRLLAAALDVRPSAA